jgi:hypothetical protein
VVTDATAGAGVDPSVYRKDGVGQPIGKGGHWHLFVGSDVTV